MSASQIAILIAAAIIAGIFLPIVARLLKPLLLVIVVLVVIVVVVSQNNPVMYSGDASAARARSALSCHDFMRASLLGDQEVLAQAAHIAQPWFDAYNEVVLGGGIGQGDAYDMPRTMLMAHLMEQLRDDCQSLPYDTVDAIVATHAKSARAQAAADRAKRAEAQSAVRP